jgi:hypothetical protein
MAKKAGKKAARPAKIDNPLSRKIPRHEAVWLEGPVPPGYWQHPDHRRRYVLWLGQQLGYRKLDDYYGITTGAFKRNRGAGALLHCWHSSAIEAVAETFPDHTWNEWQFVSCPRSFWKKRANHKRYMEWLAGVLGITGPDGWYRVTNQDFRKNKGGAFLLHYDSTISAAVMKNLPKHAWLEWNFSRTPKGFWDERRNRVRYLKWLGEKLGITSLDGWYKATRDDFEKNCGSQLVKYYNGSTLAAVTDCFKNFKWEEWKFARVPVGFWKDAKNRERYLRWLGRELNLKTPEDWSRVRRQDLKANYGGGLLAEFRSIDALLNASGLRKTGTQTRSRSPRRKARK